MRKVTLLCALLLLKFVHAGSVCVMNIQDFVFAGALEMNHCEVDDKDMYVVDRFLHHRPDIKRVYLKDNYISSEGAILLSGLPLTTVDLSGNMIGNEGIIELAKSPYLESLALNNNHRISTRAAKYLATTPNLNSLHLDNNNLNEEIIAILVQNPHLTYMGLANNKLTNQALSILVKNQHITQLDLSQNDLTDDAAAILANSYLDYLNLSENSISDDGAVFLAAHLNLIFINLIKNDIGDAGAAALATNPHLEYLAIADNRIGDEGAIALAASALKALWIKNNPIGEIGLKALRDSKIALDI